MTSVTTNIISGTAAGQHHTVPDVILTVTVHSASLLVCLPQLSVHLLAASTTHSCHVTVMHAAHCN